MEPEIPVEPQSLKKLSFKSLKKTLDVFSPHSQFSPLSLKGVTNILVGPCNPEPLHPDAGGIQFATAQLSILELMDFGMIICDLYEQDLAFEEDNEAWLVEEIKLVGLFWIRCEIF